MELHVGSTVKERRIDKYIHDRLRNVTRALIQKQIEEGTVTVNAKTVKCSYKIKPGDVIVLPTPEIPTNEIEPQDIPLSILFEDEYIIVVNKPAAMIVHPARSYTKGTLVNALLHHCGGLSTGGEPSRPGIVHRLDKNTTGVMVVAKNENAQLKIARQFHDRRVNKTYLAIVHGKPQLRQDRISAPLGLHPRAREKYAIRPETGKKAVTFYQVMEEFRGFSLLKLSPKTGRTHQLRVHMAYMKNPIVADDMYRGKMVYPWQLKDGEPLVEDPLMKRPALHAFSLGFRHPGSGEVVNFQCPLAEDMQQFLDMLREHRSL